MTRLRRLFPELDKVTADSEETAAAAFTP
jgi:hypothetical protein